MSTALNRYWRRLVPQEPYLPHDIYEKAQRVHLYDDTSADEAEDTVVRARGSSRSGPCITISKHKVRPVPKRAPYTFGPAVCNLQPLAPMPLCMPDRCRDFLLCCPGNCWHLTNEGVFHQPQVNLSAYQNPPELSGPRAVLRMKMIRWAMEHEQVRLSGTPYKLIMSTWWWADGVLPQR